MFFKISSLLIFFLASVGLTNSINQNPVPIKFAKDVESGILNAVDQCVSNSIEKYFRLLIVKNGRYLTNPKFQKFIFCAYTKSGYADEKTGRVFLEYAASVYPEHCNQIEVMKKCDQLIRSSSPVAAIFEFFMCFQKNTMCRIDLLPEVLDDSLPCPETSYSKHNNGQEPKPTKFSKDVESEILVAIDPCARTPEEKYSYLLMVKNGQFSTDPNFQQFIFCAYTKSGYADEKTGRVYLEYTASIYPEYCNQMEVLRKCDQLVRSSAPSAALFEFFVCFQKNTKCRINLLPDNLLDSPVLEVSYLKDSNKKTPKPIKFSKDVESKILYDIDKCAKTPIEKYSQLWMVKNGLFSSDPKFQQFIFCAYTKSGYADEKTGRVYLEYTASIYPEHCNQMEVLKKCDQLVRSSAPSAALFEFFVCFQKNTMCRIDLVPDDLLDPPVLEDSYLKDSNKKEPQPIKFSKDVESKILYDIDKCAKTPIEKYSQLWMVKNGQFSTDPNFQQFIFCAYTKSGYADEKTGRVYLEYTASIYPEHCNQMEVLKKCDQLVRSSAPSAALFEFFVCFQKNTMCRIDLVPDDPLDPPVLEDSYLKDSIGQTPKPVKFSKDVESGILDAVDQCVGNPIEKYSSLLMVKNGQYSTSPRFQDFIYCAHTKSGYADEKTGRVYLEYAASVYPEYCNQIKVMRKCDQLVRHRVPVDALFDFFMCFQKNTMCRIDLLPDDIPNSPDSEISYWKGSYGKKPIPIKFSKDVENGILDAVDQCVRDPLQRTSLLLVVKNGLFLEDPGFQQFIFCAYTKSGYADKKTGRVYLEYAASVYPEHCNQIEVMRKCDRLVRHRAPVAAMFDFFMCFQKNTMCRIDLLPNDLFSPSVLEMSYLKDISTQKPIPIKFSKGVESGILDAVDQCVKNPVEKASLLLVVKNGLFLEDPGFQQFIFCAYTKSGYADKTTGRVYLEHAASVYPEHCNQIEVMRKCDRLVRHRAPVAAMFDFFMCFQRNTMCRIDLLPSNLPSPSVLEVSYIKPTNVQIPKPIIISRNAPRRNRKNRAYLRVHRIWLRK